MNEACFPSADQIARAVVAAARLTGGDPEALFDPLGGSIPESRMRWFAYAGLCELFPEAERLTLGRCSGIASVRNFKAARASKWWSEDWVDEVVGAVLAPDLEAAPEPAPAPIAAEPAKGKKRAPRGRFRREQGQSAYGEICPQARTIIHAGAATGVEKAPMRRVIDRRSPSAVVSMGEPDFARSALGGASCRRGCFGGSQALARPVKGFAAPSQMSGKG